jgi:acyl dehydratase
MFASLTGSINPLYLDEIFAAKTEFKKRIIPEMLIGLMFPATQGNFLPGDGNLHLKQHLDFLKPVYIGDTITVDIEIKDKIIEKIEL